MSMASEIGNKPRNKGGNPNFKKGGPSPNPSGRGKGYAHISALAKNHSEKAIQTLANIMNRSKVESNRIAAANALLDRAWGKPSQQVQAVVGHVNMQAVFAQMLDTLARDADPSLEPLVIEHSHEEPMAPIDVTSETVESVTVIDDAIDRVVVASVIDGEESE